MWSEEFAKCDKSRQERLDASPTAPLGLRSHRARSASRSKLSLEALRGSGRSPGRVDESATGSVNFSFGEPEREARFSGRCFRASGVGNAAHMPGRLFEIRYPNGDFEMDAFTQQPPPEIGETLRRRGQLWRVVSKTFDEPFIVRVEPVSDRGKAAGTRPLGAG